MTVERLTLDQIVANPYQTRLIEDPGQVARVAESIASVGLLQTPVGRWDPGDHGIVELAFGHTRLAAFRQLAQEDPQAWAEMPIDVRELTNIEMFELAVRENLDRKDLTPIEEAKAMATYRNQFGKSSAEIGVLFGLSDSAVRNKMRLLELPAPVQEKVQSRELNEGTARRLMVLQKMAPEAIPNIAKAITGKGGWREANVDEEIQYALEEVAHNLQAGSRDWWPLDWGGTVQPPAPIELAKLLGKGAPKVAELVGIMEAFRSGTDVAGVVKLYGIDEERADRIGHLVAPPPCSACEFHQVFDGGHFCGIEACAEQKQAAWIVHETARISKKLGIPIHDPAKDGASKAEEPQEHWSSAKQRYVLEPSWQKLLDAKDEGLRVKAVKPDYREYQGTGSRMVRLVLVGPTGEKMLARQKAQTKSSGGYDYKAVQRREAQRRKKAAISKRFLEKEAAPIFASMLKPIESPAVLEALFRCAGDRWSRPKLPKLPEKKGERCARLRELIAARLLDETLADVQVQGRGLAATAKHLVGVAKALGVRLPADWTKRAEAMEPKTVSTETDEES